MRSLLVSTTVFLTVVSSVFFGVVCSYGAVLGILKLMGHRCESKPSPATMQATAK
jgi:hypothetical protein